MLKDRPKRGPYPTGVKNGPDPTTARGRRRRARKSAVAGQMNGYQASGYHKK